MELNVVTRALVDVLVWGLNNSGEKIHSDWIDVVELAQIAKVNLIIFILASKFIESSL